MKKKKIDREGNPTVKDRTEEREEWMYEDTRDDYQAILYLVFQKSRGSAGIDSQQILSGSGKGLEIKSYST